MDPQDKYHQFLQWFTHNGGKHSHMDYPAYFPPTKYIGISANKPIPRNTVIMSVPKKIIISIELVKASELGFLLEEYPCFQGEEDDNDDKDFNILTLFLIYHKMQGKRSFFHPYLQCITIAETMIHWRDEEILALDEPYLNLQFLREVKKQFEPTYLIFQEIVNKNKALFDEELTQALFYECYGMTMTRCFGWGLPETMMVPFADFMNHSSDGVHHYTFSEELQSRNHEDYIKKMKTLDLRTIGIDNLKSIPIGYEKDTREKYIQTNQAILAKMDLPLTQDVQNLSHHDFKIRFQAVRAIKLNEHFSNDICPSSESEDNDTNSESSEEEEEEYEQWGIQAIRYLRSKRFLNQLFEVVKKTKQQEYNLPKPQINRQFEQDVKFDWWHGQADSCFIVATSKQMQAGEQIFNSYGRRNNRFLLLWYGFTFQGNKYDSVPFRIWNERIERRTGQFLFTRYVTDVDWKKQIPIGNERYSSTELSPEFRFKKTEFDYELLAYLRFRVIRGDKTYAKYRSQYTELHMILDLEVEERVLELYKRVLFELIKHYGLARPKEFETMTKERKIYSAILTESNVQIVSQHCLGLDLLSKTIQELKNTQNPSLLSIYTAKLQQFQSQETSTTPQKHSNLIKQKIRNQIFIRHYFKLLEEYFRKK